MLSLSCMIGNIITDIMSLSDSRALVVCNLLLIISAGVGARDDNDDGFWSCPLFWVPAVVGGAVAGVALAPVALTAGLAGMGFTATGITAGSAAAGAMSAATTTGVGAGLVGLAQSVGAAGVVAVGTKVALGTAGAAVGYAASSPSGEEGGKK
ncbi:interferon alpha-inducible protein 27-like protein 2B isoform X2 [Haliotis rufescens]|uniref:interferon alpha-inducible protein 27-like protein 2B isoform X2 n=1 Tax=Haliotis rufescens TaxID=6454 RepID=UPI00201ECACE|nr:interferon alpha-inducible protein 27-like protein 2B isoform X2 [Haliotis rufescens]